MKCSQFLSLFCADLYRYAGNVTLWYFLRRWMLTPGIKISFYFRLCQYLARKPLKCFGLYYIFKFILIRAGLRYGIDIPASVQIGSGLYIGHFGGIVINREAVIGRNCNLSHGVTIGQVNRGDKMGSPVIGDNVFIGPGAKVIGRIRVGNCAAIGANSVVVDDVPERAVVVGVPGRVISYDGSNGYINFTDYSVD
jgi:serine O-acetyltransferase